MFQLGNSASINYSIWRCRCNVFDYQGENTMNDKMLLVLIIVIGGWIVMIADYILRKLGV